ncbi:hypothetical protein [Streptomyces tsukubensis]|uniref:Uncharacterized protein n=1 Tax=Streptomyces tsukubensis (strain DSM 42081 / NBRC 108919 / NRRL 18488 / 9993) TaxID=1114943 RepID=A0A7G3US04_STRT9|nr:hypothetical protein [Streptomyces tsukubensis]AZK92568.1 hypothetical protein B7R87_00635 [Streptomyces tsukubensis]QKM71252.1 hypothetical protein STSU_033235 [Streptomyces tsukubensis NRRL18488]TAI40418.1 hypothetical protein EWI31_32675 [Streptomyces tsukubensis]
MNARPTGSPNGPGVPETETRLQEALAAVADQVRPAPGAYRAASAGWRRRERRRRLALALLTAVVFALAVLAGVRVLNSAPSGTGFHHGPPAPTAPAGSPGG